MLQLWGRAKFMRVSRALVFKSFLRVLLVCLSFVVSSAASADALPSTCDAGFYDVMKARSTLEAMREMEVAQTLILKPDSVLEYSCFDLQLTKLGNAANLMFTDNAGSAVLFKNPPRQYSGGSDPLPTISADEVTTPNMGQTAIVRGPNPPPFPPGFRGSEELDNTLEQVVGGSAFSYVAGSFGHPFAGGLYMGGISPTCGAMGLVWKFMKCRNFSKKDFRTFSELSVVDPRDFNSYLRCNDPDRSSRWNIQYIAADLAADVSSTIDPVVTDLDFIGGNCGDAAPIQTGLIVSRNGSEYVDAFCVPAGCFYNGRGGCE